MYSLLFERIFLLSSIVFISCVISFYFFSKRTFWIVLTIGAVLILMNYLVVTDREAILMRTKILASACRDENRGLIEQILDDEFSADSLTKSEILDFAEEAFSHLKIKHLRLWGFEIDPPIIRFIALSHIVGKSGEDYGNIRSDWELTFIKRADNKWYLIGARPLSINLKPISSMEELLSTAQAVW